MKRERTPIHGIGNDLPIVDSSATMIPVVRVGVMPIEPFGGRGHSFRASMTAPDPSVTAILLRRVSEGDASARADLFASLYSQLRELARAELGDGPKTPTLQPTALVHEVWLRLSATPGLRLESRKHFLNVAASVMRRVLIDHARRRTTLKRSAGGEREPLDRLVGALESESRLALVELDEALDRLERTDADLAKIVELRFFGGLTEEEVGDVLGRTRRQVQHAWKLARAYLMREIERDGRRADPASS